MISQINWVFGGFERHGPSNMLSGLKRLAVIKLLPGPNQTKLKLLTKLLP